MSDLTALLEHEASAEIDAILGEARERREEILERARSEAEADRAARERAAAMSREALRVRSRSAAQLEASALKLRAQHEEVEAVFAAALERLSALRDDDDTYREVLGKLLEEALASLGGSAATEIVVAADDRKLATALAKEQGVEAKVVAGDLEGGVRVRTGRGSSVENTLRGRLDALRDDLASRVSEALFGETTEA